MSAAAMSLESATELPIGAPPAEVGSFTLKRVERGMSVAVGMGALALGVQALFAAAGTTPAHSGWNTVVLVLVFVPLALMVAACFSRWHVTWFTTIFAISYPIGLLIWPLASSTPAPEGPEPWIWYLINVATVAAVVAFRFSLQIVWTIGIPIEYSIIRLVQAEFSPDAWIAVGLDATFALILGTILLTLSWLFRAVAVEVDASRMAAVETFSRAAVIDAVEKERVAVAGLMHDSVLAALIAAERAASPRESALAVAMAREALTRLANAESDAGEGSDDPVSAEALGAALQIAAADLGSALRVERASDAAITAQEMVPGRVARALALAATQAITNSLEHADAVGLYVRVSVPPGGGVLVVVQDAGPGFDLGKVPDDRLGIRGSIFARVAAVGGTATVNSSSRGTTVTLAWQAES